MQSSTTCSIPTTAQAYSLNFAVVPPGPLLYISVWPTGQPQPLVSTLNDLTGTIVAAAAIVPAGTGGSIDVYATNNTDLIIDINGYYAALTDLNGNTAIGVGTLANNTTGTGNTATGQGALASNTTGHNNIAIGYLAASNVTGGNNIHVGNTGSASDSGTIRIGSSTSFDCDLFGFGPHGPCGPQTSFFAAGIRDTTTANNDALPVLIDSAGQLGTVSSSRRFKEDIQDMGDASNGLMRLRPVTFRYQKPFADGSKPIQYGLIAEEMAEVYPDLVARSADGQIETVKHQVLDSMLLNEVQRLNKENQALQERLSRLEAAMASVANGVGVQ
jgi:hypothetical protein